MMSIQDDTLPCWTRGLDSLADTVLQVDSFAGREGSVPIEFRFFCGFFLVHKLQQLGSVTPHRPSACRYGLKRDRRKLRVEPLHLPPEESRASKYDSDAPIASTSQVSAQKRLEKEQAALRAVTSVSRATPATERMPGVHGVGIDGHARVPLALGGEGQLFDSIPALPPGAHSRHGVSGGQTQGRGLTAPGGRGGGSPPLVGGGPGSMCGVSIPGQQSKYDF